MGSEGVTVAGAGAAVAGAAVVARLPIHEGHWLARCAQLLAGGGGAVPVVPHSRHYMSHYIKHAPSPLDPHGAQRDHRPGPRTAAERRDEAENVAQAPRE